MLGVAFLVKAGMWPLGFWLPGAYAAASAPGGGAVRDPDARSASTRCCACGCCSVDAAATPSARHAWLAYGGMATLAFGALGVLAAQNLARLAGYSLLVSSGTLLAAIGIGSTARHRRGALLPRRSTLGVAAFFLLIELVERGASRRRRAGGDRRGLRCEAKDEGEEARSAWRSRRDGAARAWLRRLRAPARRPAAARRLRRKIRDADALLAAPIRCPPRSWVLLALLIGSGFATIIAMARAGVRTLLGSPDGRVPRVRVDRDRARSCCCSRCASRSPSAPAR